MKNALRSPCATRVYFIQRGADGPIKVGYAESPERRLAELQVANPDKLYLRASFVGGLREEQLLHRRFADWRICGEWFQADTPGLDELIDAALYEEFFSEDLCEHCRERPIAPENRKYCRRCSR